jgi:glutamate-1-semialdehyde 2,1-aminomutase
MDTTWALYALGGAAAVILALRAQARLRLSRAKHPSLTGHSRMARRLAALVPFYAYGDAEFFASDGAPDSVAASRRLGLAKLAKTLHDRSPRSQALGERLEGGVSDIAFTNAYRVPFQYRNHLHESLRISAFVEQSAGVEVKDADGNWSYDLTGSYGVNLFGYDFYKECIERGAARVRDLGPVLGAYHPLIADNVRRLREISGLDEVSFHMSGTEAVMQAVRLAQYHTRRSHVVVFCGAYHGWWDGVQPGVGNPRKVRDVYTLADLSERSLEVLRTRTDIACVLVNPLQALHPNRAASGDATLVDGSRSAHFDRGAYAEWLAKLRDVCTARGIVLIFDEVFVGFRLARGGAQEYFGVRADLATYGKTLGGGLPVGVLCGRHDLMKRYRDDRPSDVCFARGTFNSHPYVMAAMNEFLQRLDADDLRTAYSGLEERWNARAAALNARLAAAGVPVRVANLISIWTILYTQPGRYHWMLQFYLRAEGLALSWVGSGRLIFSHNYTDADFDAVADRFIRAAEAMRADGWWWISPALTTKAIRRRILGELVRARFARRREKDQEPVLLNPRP